MTMLKGKEMKRSVLSAGCMAVAATAAICGSLLAQSPETVKVSDFGYDGEDSTVFIRKALESGARKVILDRQAGPWYTLPLKMPSNIEFVLEPGVELVAKRGAFRGKRDYLVELSGATNVTIRGGEGSAFRMWKYDYQKPPYVHSEWRYALRISNCGNVLVENLRFVRSGGDGIGVSGKDITIRRCVCDDNHRQGMSVFPVENLLVEDCVFSNTRGTAPQAGVDIEPDGAKGTLKDVVFRNCVSYGNAGNGFEMFLINMTRQSGPIDITFENCRSWGNGKNDTTLSCTSAAGKEPVGGKVRYVNCVLGPSARRCATFSNISGDAVDIEFDGCVLYGDRSAAGRPAIVTTVARPSQGVVDGLAFNNLTIMQPVTNAWFACVGEGAGSPAKRVKGRVRIVDEDGFAKDEIINEAWVKANIPVFDGGRPLPARRELPSAADISVRDRFPGEMDAVAPVAMVSPSSVVFFADRPGPCRFVMRQIPDRVKKVRRPVKIEPVGMAVRMKASDLNMDAPDTNSTEVVFNAPSRGFYRLKIARWAAKLMIEKSSVPLAFDLSQTQMRGYSPKGDPIVIGVPFGGADSTFMVSGGMGGRYKVRVSGADGKTCAEQEIADRVFVAHGTKAEKPELRRLELNAQGERNARTLTFDIYGAPPYLFLTENKFWEFK